MKHADAHQRLITIEGHIRGIVRMLENDSYCIDVIHQIQAVKSALSKVNGLLLDKHLNSCLITAVRGTDPDEREQVLKEIVEIFDETNKV